MVLRFNQTAYFSNTIFGMAHTRTLDKAGLEIDYSARAVASSIIWGGGDIHIFVFTHHKNNRFEKKLITQDTNI